MAAACGPTITLNFSAYSTPHSRPAACAGSRLGGLLTPPWRSAAATTAKAETGAGLAGGGSLSYSLPDWGLTLTAAGQGCWRTSRQASASGRRRHRAVRSRRPRPRHRAARRPLLGHGRRRRRRAPLDPGRRLGSRLSIDPGLSLSLEGTRTEPAGAADPDDSVTFTVTQRS